MVKSKVHRDRTGNTNGCGRLSRDYSKMGNTFHLKGYFYSTLDNCFKQKH